MELPPAGPILDEKSIAQREPVCGPIESLIMMSAAFVLLQLVGPRLQLRLGVGGLALTELLCVLGPALVALSWSKARISTALGLSWPPPRAILGGLLAGAGAFYLVAGGVEALQERVAPMTGELRDQLRRFVVPAEGPRPLAVDLAVLALAPALCEEALFRGVMLRAFATISRGGALLVTSMAFGAFHFSLYKFAPTALLGAVMGGLALRSGSIWPSVIAHALNNAVVVLLVRSGLDDPPAPRGPLVLVPLVAAAVVLGLGLRLAVMQPVRSPK